MQLVDLILEDVVVVVTHQLLGYIELETPLAERGVQRILGKLLVVLFLKELGLRLEELDDLVDSLVSGLLEVGIRVADELRHGEVGVLLVLLKQVGGLHHKGELASVTL